MHVAVWQAAYRGLLPDALLDGLSVDRRERMWSETLRAYADTHPVVVAEDAAIGICGFGNGGSPRGDPVPGYTGEFKTLYVLPRCQRRGIGRGLLVGIAARLADRGHVGAVAWALTASPACHFYEAMGGVRCAQRTQQEEGMNVEEFAYGWSDLRALVQRTA